MLYYIIIIILIILITVCYNIYMLFKYGSETYTFLELDFLFVLLSINKF